MFKFERDEGLEIYYLVGNKWENSQLIEEQKHVDFFLMIKSNHDATEFSKYSFKTQRNSFCVYLLMR